MCVDVLYSQPGLHCEHHFIKKKLGEKRFQQNVRESKMSVLLKKNRIPENITIIYIYIYYIYVKKFIELQFIPTTWGYFFFGTRQRIFVYRKLIKKLRNNTHTHKQTHTYIQNARVFFVLSLKIIYK